MITDELLKNDYGTRLRRGMALAPVGVQQ